MSSISVSLVFYNTLRFVGTEMLPIVLSFILFLLLGGFAKLRKAAINFVMSVRME
jgi:hypothetical protein